MRHKIFTVAWRMNAVLVLTALAWCGLALANGRDFSGSYTVSDLSVSGGTASLTFTLRLYNNTGVDISNATIVLRDVLIPTRTFGTFSSVSVTPGGVVRLSATFQVPRSEYQSWQLGRRPLLMIEYADATGNRVRRPIEVVPGRVLPDLQPEPEMKARRAAARAAR